MSWRTPHRSNLKAIWNYLSRPPLLLQLYWWLRDYAHSSGWSDEEYSFNECRNNCSKTIPGQPIVIGQEPDEEGQMRPKVLKDINGNMMVGKFRNGKPAWNSPGSHKACYAAKTRVYVQWHGTKLEILVKVNRKDSGFTLLKLIRKFSTLGYRIPIFKRSALGWYFLRSIIGAKSFAIRISRCVS